MVFTHPVIYNAVTTYTVTMYEHIHLPIFACIYVHMYYADPEQDSNNYCEQHSRDCTGTYMHFDVCQYTGIYVHTIFKREYGLISAIKK